MPGTGMKMYSKKMTMKPMKKGKKTAKRKTRKVGMNYGGKKA